MPAAPARADGFSPVPAGICGGYSGQNWGGSGGRFFEFNNNNININKSFDFSKNINVFKNFEFNNNIDLSRNINAEKNIDLSRHIEINKNFDLFMENLPIRPRTVN